MTPSSSSRDRDKDSKDRRRDRVRSGSRDRSHDRSRDRKRRRGSAGGGSSGEKEDRPSSKKGRGDSGQLDSRDSIGRRDRDKEKGSERTRSYDRGPSSSCDRSNDRDESYDRERSPRKERSSREERSPRDKDRSNNRGKDSSRYRGRKDSPEGAAHSRRNSGKQRRSGSFRSEDSDDSYSDDDDDSPVRGSGGSARRSNSRDTRKSSSKSDKRRPSSGSGGRPPKPPSAMKDSRPGSNGRRRSSDDYSERSPSRAEGSKRRPSNNSDQKARRRREDSGANSRKIVGKSREDSSRSPSRSSRQSDGSVSPPATVTPPSTPRRSPKDARSPKKRSSKPNWDAKHSKSMHAREKTTSVEGGGGETTGGGSGSSDGGSGVEAHSLDKGSASESDGSNEDTVAPSEVATSSKTPNRGTPSPRFEKRSMTTPSRLTPSPKSSKSEEEAPAEEDDSDELAGEGVMDDASDAFDDGRLVRAEKAALPASAEEDGVQSDDQEGKAVEPDRASSDDAGVGMPTTETTVVKPRSQPQPRPQVAEDAPVAPRPQVETPVLKEESAAVVAAPDPAMSSGGGVRQAKRAVGKKRPRPIKTGGSISPKLSGPPVPVGASLLAQTPAVATTKSLMPNGKRSPASGKNGGKEKSVSRGGSENKGRAGSSGGGTVRLQGQPLTGSSPMPQARRTQRAAAVVAAGKIKSTSEGGGGSLAAGIGVGNGMLGSGGGLSAFHSYGHGGPAVDDSEEEATLDGLNGPNRGASPLSTSSSKPLGPREWFCAKTKVVDMIAQDRNKVYTSSPEQSIGKGREYKSYLAMVQTPIWMQKIQDKIAVKKTDCR